MKRILKNLFFVIVPILILVLGGFWYQRSSEKAIEYARNFELLKNACETSAGTEVKADASVSEYVDGVCGCFAKTALTRRNISVAGIVGNTQAVHAILKDCSRRLPTSE